MCGFGSSRIMAVQAGLLYLTERSLLTIWTSRTLNYDSQKDYTRMDCTHGNVTP